VRPVSSGSPVPPLAPGSKPSAGSGLRRFLPVAIGLVAVAATFLFVLPKIADYGDVWDAVKDLSGSQAGVLAGATLLNLVTFAPPWQSALPGLGFARAFILTQMSTASTYIAPGGAAVGIATSYGMLRSWGFQGSRIALAAAIVGAWNQLVLLTFPVVGLGLLTLTHEQNPLLETVAAIGLAVVVAGVALFAAGLWTRRLAHWIGDVLARLANRARRLMRRGPVRWSGDSAVSLRNEALGLLKQRWHILTLTVLAGQLTVFVLFLACLRTLGISAHEVSAIEAFAAWSLVRVLGSIPITPGGVGIVEVGMTGALVGFGGDNAEVVAAVLLYRFLTVVPTLALGLAGLMARQRFRAPVDPGQ
jgi:putative heme transporter